MAGRKKKDHEGHGGAWKVAYADFITAMMALFMVLWICSQEEEILIATSLYFQNPFNSPAQNASGVMPNKGQSIKKDDGSSDPKSAVDVTLLAKLAKEFYKYLNLKENDENKPIEIQVTNDGLRIIVYDQPNRPIFEKFSTKLTEWGLFVHKSLAWLLDRYNFLVRIEAHTAAGEKEITENYSDWELTADRANMSRRTLVHFALDPEKIDRITGFASKHPLVGVPPTSAKNQRVEISLTLQ